nr:hypothetical protein [Klebsiella variicola]CEP30402.1 hypothetical protein KV8917_350046 [Klebsiella variicola]
MTLRNAIDYSIRHARLPGAAGHWRTDTNWIFDLPRYIGNKTWIRQNKRYKTVARGRKLMHHGKPVYDRTAWEEDCIRKVSKRIRAAGKAPTAERVISGLDFGFWTNFLTKNYDEPRNRSLLWPQLLPSVFPGAPAGTPRHVLEKKFTRIRDLRNRLAHHEAVWKFQEEDPVSGGYGHGAGAEQNDESRHARKRKYYLKKNKQIRDDYPKSDLFNKASLYYKRTINGRSMH